MTKTHLKYGVVQIRTLVCTAFAILLLTSPVSAQSDRDLADQYDRQYAAERYDRALIAAEKICERYPEAAGWQFKAGALLARLDRHDEALVRLQKCADLNYSGIGSFENNSDLDSLRNHQDFMRIIEQVRRNAKKRMDEFQGEAKRHKPKLYIPDDHNSDMKSMIIVALHGTGMDGQAMYDALIETAKAKNAVLVCPDALRPAGKGFSWTYRDESEWFVNKLINDAVNTHGGDPDNVILVGFSQGANIALNMGQMYADLFKAVIAICGHYEAQNAEADHAPAPFYLISGARDPWKSTYAKAKRDFTERGGRVRVRTLAGKGHELPTGKQGTKEYLKALIWAYKD